MLIPTDIPRLRDRGALFVINHSGGKDSQAMTIKLRAIVPDAQIVMIHAHLREVEWDGVIEHIRATTAPLPLYVVEARRGLLDMIAERGMFPSPQQRQCTSDLKRGPIEKQIRHLLKAGPWRPVVNCMGMRAEESTSRAKLTTFKLNGRNSIAGREWYDWLPIHELSTDEVFATIARAGQAPHWAYAAGMTRLSCCFCIMASRADLTTAARLKPDLYRRYVELERQIGQTMIMPSKAHGRRTLEQITGVKAV